MATTTLPTRKTTVVTRPEVEDMEIVQKKKAMIFGATGQDGSFLAEQLLQMGYEVFAVVRRTSGVYLGNIAGIAGRPRLHIVSGDITDSYSVTSLITKHSPDEIYNLAAQSHVGTSFNQTKLTTDVVYGGCLNILEAVRHNAPWTRVYQASSSEMFGTNVDRDGMQRETTRMLPCSPYGVAKLAAHNLVRVYRDSYGIFACSGILFNHESNRRGEQFVTRKISKFVARLRTWLSIRDTAKRVPILKLGNLDAKRDWGYAPEYTDAMWRMLQHDDADDYVIATGTVNTVHDFLVSAFGAIGLTPEDVDRYTQIDESLYRPCEVPTLCGDASKAESVLGWRPRTYMNELASLMVEFDGKTTQTETTTRLHSPPELEA